MNGKIRFALVAASALLAACGDSTVAPSANSSTSTIAGGGANASLTGRDTLRFSFVIDPSRTVVYPLGLGNSIVFPAGSLCDPATSSYGPGTWDDSCAIASRALTINATAWLDNSGHPRIDFDQHVRFAPSNDAAKWVVLSFTDFRSALLSSASIVYCATPNSSCVDEAAADPSVATVKDPATGRLTRRIKHFSGYNVFSGRCDADVGCVSDGANGLLNRTPGASSMFKGDAAGDANGKGQRQGYMLAWGRGDDEQ
jgi:hypothetical protein